MASDGLDWVGLKSIWIRTGNGWGKLHIGRVRFKISRSDLNMGESAWERLKMSVSWLRLSVSWWEWVGVDGNVCEWMGVGGSRWEWVGIGGSWWEWMGVHGSGWEWVGVSGSRWEWMEMSGSGWEYGLVKPIIKYAWTYLGKIKRPNNN